MVNGGDKAFRIFMNANTGFFAVENAGGEHSIHQADRLHDIPASEAIAFWSCLGMSDPRPEGEITVLGCSDNGLLTLGGVCGREQPLNTRLRHSAGHFSFSTKKLSPASWKTIGG